MTGGIENDNGKHFRQEDHCNREIGTRPLLQLREFDRQQSPSERLQIFISMQRGGHNLKYSRFTAELSWPSLGYSCALGYEIVSNTFPQ